MSLKRLFAVSFLVTALAWLVLAWPLPRHLTRGVPSSAHNIEKGGVRRMIVGDHLQLNYFYWLFSDMLAGGTPLFENRYEFNTGEGSERRRPGIYNVPFSLVFAAARPLGGRAFAWNITLFITLWLTHAFTWLALRRILASDALAALVAAGSIAFPFRWIMLFGGSPTGLAMMWLALLALGLNLAVREDKPAGGFLAALALLGAYLNDRHVFFFGFMAMPGLALVFLLLRETIPWRRASFWKPLLLAALPLALTGLALGLFAARTAITGFADTSLEGGRTIEEVTRYTPAVKGLIAWGGKGRNAHIYLGWGFFAIAAIHLLVALRSWPERTGRERRRIAAGVLLWAASGLTILLALGPNGPGEGALFEFARRHIPGSKALRQPAKIFCLFTVLLPAALAVAIADIRAAFGTRRGVRLASVLLPLALFGDHAAQIHTTVCLLDTAQPAYAAVAADAAAAGRPARAVIVPIWPGDSDWAALYQHYVSLYRIRMLNGYRPVVAKSYQDLVRQFSSVNAGLLDDAQADALLARGFRHLILHEDAFPEKVSSFPVLYTLDRLLAHPRLELLTRAETVWAFRILVTPRAPASPTPAPAALFPARCWDFDKLPRTNVIDVADATACNGAYTTLSGAGSVTGRPLRVDRVPDPALLLRLRGHGTLLLAPTSFEPAVPAAVVETNEWTWFRVPLDPARTNDYAAVMTVANGSVDADFGMLLSGEWTPPQPGRRVTFPAACFFHAGYSDPAAGTVSFRPDYEPADYIFYGPRLPFAAGPIEIELELETPAPPGTKLGRLLVDNMGAASGPIPVIAGEPVRTIFQQQSNRPLTIFFEFRRRAPVTIRSVSFTPLGHE